jgi:hypothetical protein
VAALGRKNNARGIRAIRARNAAVIVRIRGIASPIQLQAPHRFKWSSDGAERI